MSGGYSKHVLWRFHTQIRKKRILLFIDLFYYRKGPVPIVAQRIVEWYCIQYVYAIVPLYIYGDVFSIVPHYDYLVNCPLSTKSIMA